MDDDAGRAGTLLLEEIDQLPLVIALEEADLETELARPVLDDLLQVFLGPRPVDVRLALAQQVEVRTVDDHDALHARDLVMTRRTRAPGTAWPISACPMRRGMTHATLPRLAFLFSATAASSRLGSACGGLSGRPRAASSPSFGLGTRLLLG